MAPEQLSSMNTWLAVIAIASVIQVVALAVMSLVGYRLYARSRDAIDEVQQQIEPVKRRVTEVLDNVNAEVARLRRAGDRVEDSMAAVSHGVNAATSAVKTAVLPGWAVTRGVMAAVSAFTGRDRRNGRASDRRSKRQEYDETRFVNEGGNDARDEDLRF
jgi:hypothetical protein